MAIDKCEQEEKQDASWMLTIETASYSSDQQVALQDDRFMECVDPPLLFQHIQIWG